MELSKTQVERLGRAFSSSNDALEPFRRDRADIINMYAGPGYGRQPMYAAGEQERTPVNLTELFVNIYMQSLAARRPQAMVNADTAKHRALAADIEADLNKFLEREEIEQVFRRATLDSLFGMGIVCTALAPAGYDEDGVMPGRLECYCIDLDDWVHNMGARAWDANELQWCGHRIRLPYKQVVSGGAFKVKDKDSIYKIESPDQIEDYQERVEHMQRRGASVVDLFEPLTEVFHMWLPRQNLIAIFPMQGNTIVGSPILEEEWTGPEGGPYDLFKHVDIPNNTMPQSPLSYVRDIDLLYNALLTKQGRNALEQKTVYQSAAGAEEDAKKFIEAEDGELVSIANNAATPTPVTLRGINQESLVFTMQLRQLFSYASGNLDVLGGLGAQTGTVGQDELLSRSASERVKSMQKNVLGAVRSVCRKLAYFRYSDPMFRSSMTRPIPGMSGIEVPVELDADRMAQVSWDDLNLDIEPFSMRDISPTQQASAVMEILRGVMLPLMPILQQQGMGIDVKGLLRTMAELTNTKKLDEIIMTYRPPSDDAAPGPSHEGGFKSPVTRREEIRRSMPRSGGQAQESAMMASLLSRPKQGTEMAAPAA